MVCPNEGAGFQDVMDIMENGYPESGENAIDAQKATHKENKRKDCKAMFLLHQCVNIAHFEKIAAAKTAKQAWEILEKCYMGADQLKKMKQLDY